MADNLLDKASILLTPTAYDNGSMLSIKPTNVDGDFTFSRNSAATRVNAQGLVENVQILSSDLVQNGSFSQIGAELITNGDFATDSNWAKGTGWTISGGTANSIPSGSQGISQGVNGDVFLGKTYKVEYTISNYVGGAIRSFFSGGGNAIGATNSGNGTYVDYLTLIADNTTFKIIATSSGGGFEGSIDNVSVKEVGQDWTFGDGFTPDQANSKATCDGTQSAATNLTQTISTNIQNKLVRVSFTLDYTAGVLLGSLSGTGAVDFNNITSSGTYTAEMTSNEVSPPLILQGDANFIGSITNIVLLEVTNDTNLPRINYENGCGSWLLEDESTNLIPYSEDFSNSDWSKTRCTIDGGGHISPSGANNAFKMTATDDDARLQDGSSPTGVLYTQSIYVKSATGSNVNGQIDFTGAQIQTFTATDKWQRVETTSDLTRVGRVRVRITNSGDELFIWGAQLEQQSYATSYIPTLGASSTRLQDLASGSGNSTLINSTEGTLYFEGATLVNSGSNRYISLLGGSSRISILFRTLAGIIRVNGTGFSNIDATGISQDNNNKIAVSYSASGIKLFINGVLKDFNTDNPNFSNNSLNSLDFDLNGTSHFFGKTKAVAVFKEALTDAELTALTTI